MSETITPVVTLTLEDLRRCSPELRARTLSQVSGIVWFWRGVEDDFSTRSEIRRHEESAGSERATTGRIIRLIRWVEGQAGTRFRRSTRRTARVIQACAGPVFLTGELSDGERWKDPANLRGISRADIGPFFSLGGTADAFYSASIFMARADARLPKNLFEVSRSLPARGLAPVADAYSRLRWAANDLERYLCLFDAFECLIRLSLFRLWIVPGEEQTAEEFRARAGLLEKPTMGLWLPPLRKAVKERRSSRGVTTAAIVSFWNGKVVDSQKDLVEAANGVGLSVGGEVPRTHLGFLDFLVRLRNETKGHGGISDRDARPLWEKLQETFLHACAQLAPLVLD
ncbi:hypothetical protein EG835_13845, partial [bacterium]|nr:hypothetical protein [bacterium]